MRITAIDIRDFKRIRAFHASIDQEKGVVLIGGENAQGKTSVLDGIESALTSIPKSIKNPVHDGAPGAAIRIQIPPFTVKRWFDASGKPGLKVIRDDDGIESEVGNPSQFLKDLLGGFPDPVKFLQGDPRDQRAELIRLVGLDTTKIDNDIIEAQQRQKYLEAAQEKWKHQVEDLEEYPDAPAEETQANELAQRLEQAMATNAANQQQRDAIGRMDYDIGVLSDNARRAAERIKALEAELAEAKAFHSAYLEELKAKEADRAAAAEEVAKLTDIDIAPIQSAIASVDMVNAKVRANKAKAEARAKWREAEKEVGEMHNTVKALQAEKKRMLAEAKFPVEGLGFDADGVTFNGQPLSQASQAERIRAAVGVALAQKGRLAVVLIRDASTLDNKSLALLAEEAEKAGAQVFAEVIANREGDGYDKECSIYIEDGEVWTPEAGVQEGA